MSLYNDFDYLCNEPFYLPKIGNVICPTLRDIRKVTYSVFCSYISMLTMSFDQLKPEDQENYTSLYFFLFHKDIYFLANLLKFFIADSIDLDMATCTFSLFTLEDNKKNHIGKIDNENFDSFRNEMCRILGIREAAPLEYENELARKINNKLHQAPKTQNSSQDSNYDLDNMILKFCTHNKTGINILNVWDMTYYQFMCMFREFCNARQCDFNDAMAANSFQLKKSSDYKPFDYMKKLK